MGMSMAISIIEARSLLLLNIFYLLSLFFTKIILERSGKMLKKKRRNLTGDILYLKIVYCIFLKLNVRAERRRINLSEESDRS